MNASARFRRPTERFRQGGSNQIEKVELISTAQHRQNRHGPSISLPTGLVQGRWPAASAPRVTRRRQHDRQPAVSSSPAQVVSTFQGGRPRHSTRCYNAPANRRALRALTTEHGNQTYHGANRHPPLIMAKDGRRQPPIRLKCRLNQHQPGIVTPLKQMKQIIPISRWQSRYRQHLVLEAPALPRRPVKRYIDAGRRGVSFGVRLPGQPAEVACRLAAHHVNGSDTYRCPPHD